MLTLNARTGVANIQTAVQAFKVSKGDYPPDLDTLTRPLDDRPAPLGQPDLADPCGQHHTTDPVPFHPQTPFRLPSRLTPQSDEPARRWCQAHKPL